MALNEAPLRHGEEPGYGVVQDTLQDPSHQMGYQKVERDDVARTPRNRFLRVIRSVPLPLLLIAGIAIPAAIFFSRRRR
jgi:hypothetical protein